MMKNLKALILTDHSNHTSENSLYALTRVLLAHAAVHEVHVASRKTGSNASFFKGEFGAAVHTTKVDGSFHFDDSDHPLDNITSQNAVDAYDFVWLRLPPPLGKEFLEYLEKVFVDSVVINNPNAIFETGSKEFLLNFEAVCPPMKACKSLEDIIDFSNKFPIVLKPLRAYGGKGILKIDGSNVFEGSKAMTFEKFAEQYQQNQIDYLAVKYLENVKDGDKRIIVIDGNILGASLRLPAEDSWMCNVAMGGSSHQARVTSAEIEIVKAIDPILNLRGIVMYGVDTLMGDEGKRVLSEINTTSIGGLPQIAALDGKPLVEQGINLIMNYVLNRLQ